MLEFENSARQTESTVILRYENQFYFTFNQQ